MNLALEGTEVPVGQFNADILAVEMQTGRRVLIENQLEQADHGHLGQILTYLAGLEAYTVVWTARRFRDEHLSAIRWLNMHTTEDFSFFAVEVRAVCIGNSPIAPLLRIVEKPNNWDRQLQQSSLVNLGEKPYQLANEFWTATLKSYPDLQGEARTGPGGSNVWHALQGSPLILSLAYSVRGVGWFIRGLKGMQDSQVTEWLRPYISRLEAELDVKADMTLPESTALQKWISRDMRNRENWNEAGEWINNQKEKVVRAFARCLEQPSERLNE